MAEQNTTVDAVGCLGRVLTSIGAVWGLIAILASIGVLNRIGLGSGFIAAATGSLIPAILLLAAGRALRRRSRAARPDLPVPPEATARRVPSSRQPPAQQSPIPPPSTLPTPPRPAPPPPRPKPVISSIEDPEPTARTAVSPSIDPAPGPAGGAPVAPAGRPKTSEELIEEARKRWGTSR